MILRCAGLSTLRKAISSGAKSMSDQNIKDTIKTLRGGLAEKAGAVVRGAADVSGPPSRLALFRHPLTQLPAHPRSASSR